MKKVYFIGIGGIGVSALAKYYLAKSYKVSGSDLVSSEITKTLKKTGAKIFIGPHKSHHLTPGIELVIYSPAVPKDNPELKKARELKIKCQSYPEALGELTKQHFTIAVSGTHGKSTTCAMIGLILTKAGFDPTVIVGTKLKEFGESNCRVGKSRYLVIEADEWQASFLKYFPKIIVLTNIEAEHLDYYKNLGHILKTYREYINRLPKDYNPPTTSSHSLRERAPGILVANKDDKNILQLTRNKKQKTVFFSLKQKNVKRLKKILKIPGEHNISNALAALAVAWILKIPDKISFKALSQYKGAWRRFETKQLTIDNKQLTVISDYGHHPTEIRVTLKAAREKYPQKEIWCVFQPHQYQRTFYLFNDFVKAFKVAPINRLVITDIYDVAGREEKKIKERINSKKLVEKIKKPWAVYLPKDYNPPTTSSHSRSEWAPIIRYLKKNLQGGEVIIIMGAGDIYQLANLNFWKDSCQIPT